MRRRILSGDGRGLQNRQRARESALGWVRLPHASAKPFWIGDLGLRIFDAAFSFTQQVPVLADSSNSLNSNESSTSGGTRDTKRNETSNQEVRLAHHSTRSQPATKPIRKRDRKSARPKRNIGRIELPRCLSRQNQPPISSTNSPSSKKKPTNQRFGWKCLKTRRLSIPTQSQACAARRTRSYES